MKRRRSYYNGTAFLDLLFNALVGFVMLFILAFMSIAAKTPQGQVHTKAEFLITVTWDDESKDDIDVYLQDPVGNLLNYQHKDIGLAHLDRDDLGQIRDYVRMPDGSMVVVKDNQELTSIRGFIDGEWVLNLHVYAKRDPQPAHVRVRFEKLNPSVKTVFEQEFDMAGQGEEITVGRFQMSPQGEILNWDRLPKNLVRSAGGVPAPAAADIWGKR